jgi:hypothetical protein
MNIKVTRLLLYTFTASCAAVFLLFMLSVLFSLERPAKPVVAAATPPMPEAKFTPLPTSPNIVRATDDETISLEHSADTASTRPAGRNSGSSSELLDVASPVAEMKVETTHEAKDPEKEDVVPISTASAVPVLPKLRPISENAAEGHIVASHLIGLEIGSEFDQILEGVGLTFVFVVLDASSERGSKLQGLRGHLQLDFIIRQGFRDVKTAFRRDSSLLNDIPLRIGRGELLLFELVPDLTKATGPRVASAFYADFVPVNLLEALPAVGSVVDAPLWIEVDGNRTILSSSMKQHVLEVFVEAKRQHELKWRAEFVPGQGLRYVPK